MGFTNTPAPSSLTSGVSAAGVPYVDFTSASRWGIDAGGAPYFDPAGAFPPDAAVPEFAPSGAVDLYRSP